MTRFRITHGLLLLALALLLGPLVSQHAQAQDPTERQIRGYIPPDQLVSFRPETPFSQFIDFINPIFERVTGKQVIDPESRAQPIGVPLSGVYFLDALELVLNFNGLAYRETDRYFLIEEAPENLPLAVGQEGAALATTPPVPATLDTREVQINVVLFSINKTRARDIGVDWNVFFGGQTASSGGRATQGLAGASGAGTGTVGGGATGTNGSTGSANALNTIPRFFVNAENLADAIDNFLITPDIYDVATLTQFFRFIETSGAGQTIANPSVTVQSGEQGRIQIGTDFPFVTRDFSGNTITNFVSTGIIIDVTPTLIREALADTAGAPELNFIHMNVRAENSNGQITQAGPLVDRSSANTQVLLLDGEQTVIGGLYSTDEIESRRGIPFLKDLPGWFFGIRYLTGVTQTTQVQRELVILLEAKLVDPLRARADRPLPEELLEKRRQDVLETLRKMDENAPNSVQFEKVFQEQ